MDGQTQTAALRDELVRALEGIYQLEAFGALSELLQGEALVLRYLMEHSQEAVYPSVLSQKLRLSRSRITGTLASLRRKGLIEMRLSDRDRRMIQVTVTAAGRSQITAQTGRMLAYFDRMLTGLGEADAAALIGLIDRCVRIMEE